MKDSTLLPRPWVPRFSVSTVQTHVDAKRGEGEDREEKKKEIGSRRKGEEEKHTH